MLIAERGRGCVYDSARRMHVSERHGRWSGRRARSTTTAVEETAAATTTAAVTTGAPPLNTLTHPHSPSHLRGGACSALESGSAVRGAAGRNKLRSMRERERER
jgi:hypothetical protein